jgi:hypothetical protein
MLRQNVGRLSPNGTPMTKKGRDMILLQLTPVPLLAIALLGGVACSEATPGDEEKESAKREQKDFESAAVVFQHAAEKYTYAKREQFIAELKKALKETSLELDNLSKGVEGLSGAAKAKARLEIKELRDRRTQLEKQNDAAMTATEFKWDGIRDGMTDTFTELMDSFRKFRKSLS